ncbi:MAG: GtrA family protein [Nocardiaceae bacterium]|nr:GtrA family protein [Nocardiaceae bacterium]
MRFVVTGGLSAIVDFGLLLILLKVGLPFAVAKSISFIVGTTTAYLINRRWTFKAEPSRARFIAVVVLYALTFAVQVGISTWLNSVLADEWWRVPLAFVVAQGTATVINFVVQRAVIFKIR